MTTQITKADTTLKDILSHNVSANFIFAEELVQFVSICVLTDQSGMLYGTGGTGKTDIIRTCLESLAPKDFLQVDCFSTTSSTKLLGGAAAVTKVYEGDPRDRSGEAIRTQITSEGINYENGPLNFLYTLFDEVLDTPMEGLAALKGVMTLREHGGFKSRHRAFFGATNLDPDDVLKESDVKSANSTMAFFKRWLIAPFELPNYEPETYKTGIDFFLDELEEPDEFWIYDLDNMLSLEQEMVEAVTIPEEIRALLSNMSSRSSSDKGYIVNFRDIRWAVRKILKASAYLRGASEVGPEDFQYLKYLKAWAPSTYEDLATEMEELQERQRQQSMLYKANQFALKYGSLSVPSKYSKSPENYFHTLQTRAEEEIKTLEDASWTDNFVGLRDRSIQSLRDLAAQAESRKVPSFSTVKLED